MTQKIDAGITLVELVIVIVLIGILASSIFRVLFVAVDTSELIYESSEATQEAQSVFNYMQQLAGNSGQIIAASTHNMTLQSGSDQYIFSVSGYPGNAPYRITIQKNSNPGRPIAENIAETTAPSGPGFHLSYKNAGGTETGTTSDITEVVISLTFQGDKVTYNYVNSIWMDQTSSNLHTF